jgi:hypothetical protein
VQLQDFKGTAAHFILRTTTGQVVYNNKMAVSSPSATLTINLPNGLSRGTYLLQVQNANYSEVTKVLIQ